MAKTNQELIVSVKLQNAEFIKGAKQIEKEIDNVSDSVDNLGNEIKDLPIPKVDPKPFNDTGKGADNLKTRLREVKKELLTLSPDSARFKELREEAGQLTEQIGDVNEAVKNLAQDGFERGLGAGIGAIEVGAASFGLVQSSLNLLGIESNIVNTSLEKLAATTTLLNSINAIKQAIDEKSALSLFLQSKGITAASVSQKAKNIVDTAAIGIQNLLSKSIGVTNISLKALRTAIISTGIGALVVGIGLLIANFDKLASALGFAGDEAEELSERQKRIAENTAEAEKELAKESVQALNLFNQLKKTNAGSKERKTLIDEINKTYGTTLKNLKDEEAFLKAVAEAQREVIKSIEAKVKSRVVEAELEALLLKQRQTEKQLDEDDIRILEINNQLRGELTAKRRQELEIERAIIQTKQAQRQLEEVKATDILTGEINNVLAAKKQLVEQYESESEQVQILLNELAKLQAAQIQNTNDTNKQTEKRKSTLEDLFAFQIDILKQTDNALIDSFKSQEQAEKDKLLLDRKREQEAAQEKLDNIIAVTDKEIAAKKLAQELLNEFLKKETEKTEQELAEITEKYNKLKEQQNIDYINERLDQETSALLTEKSNQERIIAETISNEKEKQVALIQLELETSQKLLDILRERALADGTITDEETQEINNKVIEIIGLFDELKKAKKEFAQEPLIDDEEFEKIQFAFDQVSSLLESFSETINAGFENQAKQIDANSERQKQGIKESTLTERQKAKKIQELDEETAQKKYKLEKEQFEVNKGIQLVQAIINTALGITNAFATLLPPFNFIQAAIVAATGAAQIATISAQEPPPPPTFEIGGYTGDGNIREESRALGRKDYIYHKGEYVVPNKVLRTQRGSNLVESLESMRLGKPSSLGMSGFADGGFTANQSSERVNSLLQANEISNVVTEALKNVTIVTRVTDINRVNSNLAQTKARATLR